MTPATTTSDTAPDTLDGLLALMGVRDPDDDDATVVAATYATEPDETAPPIDREHLIAQTLADLSDDSAEAFRPAGLSAAQADLFNLFYARAPRSRLSGEVGERRWTWRLETEHRRSRSAIELSSAAGSFVMTLAGDYKLQDDWDLDWRPHTGDARLLAWTLYYEPLVEHLSATLGLQVEPAAVLDLIEDTVGRTRIDFSIDDGEAHGVLHGSLYLPVGASADTFAALRGEPVAFSHAASVPVRFAIQVATCLASPGEIRGLAPGDAIAIGSVDLVGDGATVILPTGSARRGLAATLCRQGRALTLGEPLRGGALNASHNEGFNAMSLSNAPHAPSSAESGGLGLSDLPVTLSFEAGTLEVSVADLSTLNAGTVLVLDRKVADAPVTVRANGRALAHGEFVTINDFLAVRILHTFAHGSE